MRPEFQDCIQMLRSHDAMTYEDGYQWLQGYLESHIDDILRLLAEERDPIDRSRIVELVGDSRLPRVIPILKDELKHAHSEVRMWAFLSLSSFGNPEAEEIASDFRALNPDEEFL